MKIITKTRIVGFALAAVLTNPVLVQAAEGLFSKKSIEPIKVKISSQPEDQLVKRGDAAHFKVSAGKGARYQWMFNCNILPGQTNSSLYIPNVGTNDVGYYQVVVHQEDESAMSQPATLMSYSTSATTLSTNIIVDYFPPPGGGGPGTTNCPRPYVGYVNFRKLNAPYGWFPAASSPPGLARHLNSTLTDVKFFATAISGCGNNGQVTVTPMTTSKAYRFTVYFPSANFASVPSGVQQLELTGFLP